MCFEKTHFIFCSSFQNLRLGGIKLLQKIVASPKNQHIQEHIQEHIASHVVPDHGQSTESPIFDASFWSENGVSCPHERKKIGDSVIRARNPRFSFVRVSMKPRFLTKKMHRKSGIPCSVLFYSSLTASVLR
jgi:hypothetical protein